MSFYAVLSINRIQIFKSYLKALKIGKYIDLHYRFHLEPYSSKFEYQIATTPISCKLSYKKSLDFSSTFREGAFFSGRSKKCGTPFHDLVNHLPH